jgi:hypothetical protein
MPLLEIYWQKVVAQRRNTVVGAPRRKVDETTAEMPLLGLRGRSGRSNDRNAVVGLRGRKINEATAEMPLLGSAEEVDETTAEIR